MFIVDVEGKANSQIYCGFKTNNLKSESLILRVNEIKAPDGSDYRGKVVPDARKNLLKAFEASVHLQIQILQKSSELKKSRVSDELTRVNNARNCEAPSEVLIEVADFDYLEYNLLTLELSALRGEDCVVGDVPSLADVRNSERLRSLQVQLDIT